MLECVTHSKHKRVGFLLPTEAAPIGRVDADSPRPVGQLKRIKIKKIDLLNLNRIGQVILLDTGFQLLTGLAVGI